MDWHSGKHCKDIADAANVQKVMKNGRLYAISELEEPFTTSGLAAASTYSQPAHENRVLSPIVDDAAARAKYWWHDPALMVDECAPER